MASQQELLWEIMESEAVRRYIIGDATKSGILICNGPFTAPDAKRSEFYTVYFGNGIAHWNFKNLKLAEAKAEEILSTAKETVSVRVFDKSNNIVKRLSFSPQKA
jgi:hypothetical protein